MSGHVVPFADPFYPYRDPIHDATTEISRGRVALMQLAMQSADPRELEKISRAMQSMVVDLDAGYASVLHREQTLQGHE